MRRIGIITLATAVVVAASAAAAISTTRKTSFAKVDRQDFTWRDEPISTSSSEFEKIPGLSLVTCNRRGLTIEVNGDYTGGPVDIRVVLGPGQGKTILPGVAHYEASAEPASFSFTFGKAGGDKDHRQFDVEWRSPTATEVTLNHALVRALYDLPKEPCL